MPDWTYQPFFRPLLQCLPAARRRGVVLAGLGLLGRSPRLIEAVGHFGPSPALAVTTLGLHLASPVGLGAGVDPGAAGLAALARFGVGFAEVGPVSASAGAALAARLRAGAPWPVPVGVRLALRPDMSVAEVAAEHRALLATLAPLVQFVSVELPTSGVWTTAAWRDHLATLVAAGVPLLVALPAALEPGAALVCAATALACGAAGLIVACGPDDSSQAQGLSLLAALRARWPVLPISASGAATVAQATALLAAGATLVQVAAGLARSGPGLPKRINEALLFARQAAPAPAGWGWPWQQRWLWPLGLALGMLLGGLLAAMIALTRVVLPYDETFVGLSRAELAALNPRLLPFMAHDRITLAGTMVSIGVLYLQLTWHGLRRGVHWARRALEAVGGGGLCELFSLAGLRLLRPTPHAGDGAAAAGAARRVAPAGHRASPHRRPGSA